MIQKLENKTAIELPGVDLTDAENLTVFLRQDAHEFKYWNAAGAGVTIDPENPSWFTLTIPYEDAMQLLVGPAKLQAFWIDGGENGTGAYKHTDAETIYISENIAEDGFYVDQT